MSESSRAVRVLILAVVATVAASDSVSARTYYVRKSGNDRNAGTSAAAAFKTLTRAFRERLTYGDTLYIGAGSYSRPMRIRSFASVPVGGAGGLSGGLAPRPLRVVADITGRFTGDRGNVLVAVKNRWAATVPLNASVQFEGIIFGPSEPSGRYHGIYANGLTSTVSMSNCTFRNVHYGVLVRTGNLIAGNCLFTDMKYGVFGAKAARCVLAKCRFENAKNIAAALHASDSVVQDCVIQQAKYGLYVRGFGIDPRVSISELQVSSCKYGCYGVQARSMVSGQGTLFRDCQFDIYLAKCDSEVSDLIVDRRSQRPLTLNRGTAVIRGMTTVSTQHHGLYAINMDGLSISQSRFGKTPKWGVYAHGRELSVTSSTFDGASKGLYVRELTGLVKPTLNDLKFSNCSKVAVQVVSSTVELSEKSKIELRRCGYGIGLINCSSEISGLKLTSAQVPLYLNGGTCVLDNVTLSNAGSYGVLAQRMSDFSVNSLTCRGAKSWGVYGSGQKLALTNTTVTGNGHGVYLRGQRSSSILLSDVEIRGNSGYGLHVRDASFALQKGSRLRSLENGDAGIYVRGNDIDLTNGSDFEVTKNRIGIYAKRSNIRLTDFQLKGNRYGLLQHHGRLECQGTSIAGGKYGIYQFHGPVCVLNDTTIAGTSSWGVVLNNSKAKSQRVELNACQISGCGGGLSARLPNDAALTVSDSSIVDNRSHGIRSWRATGRVTKSSVARNSGYGLFHYDGSLNVSDSTIEANRRFGILVYGYENPAAARMQARRNRVTGNGGGIYAYQVEDAEIVNNVSARNRAYGVVVNVSGRGDADVWNNSLVDNRHGVWHQNGRASICNNIIANGDLNSSMTNAVGIYSDSSGAAVNHNLLFGQRSKYVNVQPGKGDVIKPPRFRDHSKGDYRLASGSPAINAGTSAGRLTVIDIDGLSRPMFHAFEIGAFEYPEKSGSVRILNWGELARPDDSVSLDGGRVLNAQRR